MLDFKYVTKGRKTFGTGSRWNDYERLPKGHWRSQWLYYISDASVIPLSIPSPIGFDHTLSHQERIFVNFADWGDEVALTV
jgi:hypothetical protein